MSQTSAGSPDDRVQSQRALASWDSEGGAGPCGAQTEPELVDGPSPVPNPGPKMGEAEFVALHIRVIALENLLIALLATATDQQLELTREMASYISPREGFKRHRLTTHAASHMIGLVERAHRFRSVEQS